jgi:hypothetical protein
MEKKCLACVALRVVKTKEDLERMMKVAIEIRTELIAKMPRTLDAHDPMRRIRFLETSIKLVEEMEAISKLHYDIYAWEQAMSSHTHGYKLPKELYGIDLLFGRAPFNKR